MSNQSTSGRGVGVGPLCASCLWRCSGEEGWGDGESFGAQKGSRGAGSSGLGAGSQGLGLGRSLTRCPRPSLLSPL